MSKELEVLNLKAGRCEPLTNKEIMRRNDLTFKENKKCIDFILKGYNKYFYAAQCAKYCKFIEANGIKGYTAEDITKCYVCYNSYYGGSIRATLVSGGVTIVKSFNEKQPMLEYVVGFNEAISTYIINPDDSLPEPIKRS